MNDAMAVNLKTIPTENVTISYAYSLNEDLDEQTTITTNTKFECQVLPAKNDQIYIYVVISPNEGFNSVNFTHNIVWYMGMKGQINIVNGTETITQTIVKGQEINASALYQPAVPEKYVFDGYYYDKEYKKKATFPLKTQGASLYTKIVYDRSDVYALNGTTDSEGYTLYGAYPQDYVGNTLNTALINELNAGTLVTTDWEYTIISGREEMSVKEYVYNGEYYAYLEKSNVYKPEYTFNTDTSTIIGNGNSYFFKVEPLRWINQEGVYLCEYGVASCCFSSGTVLWENSEMRQWLNEIFYIESGINLVNKTKTTIQNNSINGEIDAYNGNPTEDYIWLPSYQEINSWCNSTNERLCGCSDITLAIFTNKTNNYSGWWTRSAVSETCVYTVDSYYGDFKTDKSPRLVQYTIRPCFSLG